MPSPSSSTTISQSRPDRRDANAHRVTGFADGVVQQISRELAKAAFVAIDDCAALPRRRVARCAHRRSVSHPARPRLRSRPNRPARTAARVARDRAPTSRGRRRSPKRRARFERSLRMQRGSAPSLPPGPPVRLRRSPSAAIAVRARRRRRNDALVRGPPPAGAIAARARRYDATATTMTSGRSISAIVKTTRRIATLSPALASGVFSAGASIDAYSRATNAYAPMLRAAKTQTKIAR